MLKVNETQLGEDKETQKVFLSHFSFLGMGDIREELDSSYLRYKIS